LQRVDDSSGEETTASGSDLNGPCFDDPEEEDNAEGEQDKERKGDDVCKHDREDEKQQDEENDETTFARIPEEIVDPRQKLLDQLQPLFDDIAVREVAIFLQIVLDINTHLSSRSFLFYDLSFQIDLYGIPHPKWLVPPNRICHCIQTR
jgi:hypothetical protein